MSRRVEIISTPPGGAPEEIRQAWVSLILPLDESDVAEDGLILTGVDDTAPQNEGGYRISILEALDVLVKSNPEAAQWWNERLPFLAAYFVFHKDVCRIVEE